MSTDTPRTDAAVHPTRLLRKPDGTFAEAVDAVFARQLERELAAETEKVKRLRKALQLVVSVSDKFCADNNVKIESDCVTNARATLEATK